MYVICQDFDRDRGFNAFSETREVRPCPCSDAFLEQLVQCSQVFQSNQIHTIEFNLTNFQNQQRDFIKNLHAVKSQTLDDFLDRCQVRQRLSTDRSLLKSDVPSPQFHTYAHAKSRTGTFNDQHHVTVDQIREKVRRGSFCLICSRKTTNEEMMDLCQTCQILSQIIDDRSFTSWPMLIGQLVAEEATRIVEVTGRRTNDVRHSPFCNGFLIELCPKIALQQDETMECPLLEISPSEEIDKDEFEQLQGFAATYEIHVSSAVIETKMNFRFVSQLNNVKNVYHVRAGPILTRRQASVIYVLVRTFEHASVYIVPSATPHLLFHFQNKVNVEYRQIQHDIASFNSATLLQFVDLHQLLGMANLNELVDRLLVASRRTLRFQSDPSEQHLLAIDIRDMIYSVRQQQELLGSHWECRGEIRVIREHEYER